jgi:hypothetical protein
MDFFTTVAKYVWSIVEFLEQQSRPQTTDSGRRSPCRPTKETAYKPAPDGMSRSKSSLAAPSEKDGSLRAFRILNPEGEVHTIDTSDPSSRFYGPVWTRILDAYQKGDFLRGRAFLRRISHENRFSGYSVSIDGVGAFLPQSRSQFFYDVEKDATNKCLALKVEMVYPNGAKQGNIIVEAKSPWKQIVGEFKNMFVGKTMYALAADYEDGALIFPGNQRQSVSIPLDEALALGRRSGIAAPDFLTGLYWKLELRSCRNGVWYAKPLEVMN